MSRIDILVPNLPESIINATVAAWHKKPGEIVQRDEILVEIETDKVVLEVPALESGILETMLEEEGATVIAHQVIGYLRLSNNLSQDITNKSYKYMETSIRSQIIDSEERNNDLLALTTHHFVAEHNLNPNIIEGSGMEERLTGEDFDKYTVNNKVNLLTSHDNQIEDRTSSYDSRREKRIPMNRLRKRIAERLLEAKNSTAMLTTFNEVNMQPVIDLRNRYGNIFKKRHGIRLGFMSFYIKATLEALKNFPEVNAFIDGEDIIYHNYFDINIAVSTPRGLVTPVLKNVSTLGIADIEKKVKELAIKGRNGELKVEDLIGGNFTITNGGIFGSLMSTPIINPPQSAILGMHAIKDRPMAVGGKIVILPMMYLALSYDHRLIDGKESVSFLIKIKEILEDPTRLLLDI